MKNKDDKKEMKSEVVGWEAKAEEYKAGWQRAVADMDNFRKRTEEMRGEIAEFVRAEVMTEFLGVYEDLKRARQSMDKANPQQMMIGVGAILEKFEGILKNNGLEQINPQPGEEFNPNEEEAIAYEPSESVADNHIIQTFETGLKVKGRIIKPARVRVSKGKLTEVENE